MNDTYTTLEMSKRKKKLAIYLVEYLKLSFLALSIIEYNTNVIIMPHCFSNGAIRLLNR